MLVKVGQGTESSGTVLRSGRKRPTNGGVEAAVRIVSGDKGKHLEPRWAKTKPCVGRPTSIATIVQRLAPLRGELETIGLHELAARFPGVEDMAGGQIGAAVIGALTVLQEARAQRMPNGSR
jgi:hypothetical protein